MPVVEARVVVPVAQDVAFAVSQTTGAVRMRWDPFIRGQHFLDAATHPGKGVRTATNHRSGLTMVSEYVSWSPPSNVGMKMVGGPWFFKSFAGGWQFRPARDRADHTEAVWRYHFAITPSWLAPVGDRLGTWVLSRDIERRIQGFAAGCLDPVVVAAATTG